MAAGVEMRETIDKIEKICEQHKKDIRADLYRSYIQGVKDGQSDMKSRMMDAIDMIKLTVSDDEYASVIIQELLDQVKDALKELCKEGDDR